ncbi:MAG: D-alanyl-D-alanine carboxypeptidase family protein [Clostridia bacterium]|nr:D-alanyl-D-alanine carboxypeptidase family protein [Clostridia bacterium]
MDDKNRTVSACGHTNSPENASAGSRGKTQSGVDASVLAAISQTEARRRAISGTEMRNRVTPARGGAAPAASSARPDGRAPGEDAAARPEARATRNDGAPSSRTADDRTVNAAPREKDPVRGSPGPARISPEELRAQREREKKAEEAAFRERLRKEEEAKAAAAAEKKARNERLAKEKAAERAAKEAKKERARRIREEKADLARAEARERAERFREKASAFFGICRCYAGYFLLFTAVVAAAAAVGVVLSLVRFRRADYAGMTKEIVYTVGSKRIRKQSASELIRNGVIYTDLGDVAGICGLSVSGNTESVRISSPDGEYAVFTADSATVDVNGNRAVMEGPAVIRKKSVSVPLSFVRDYMTGVEVVYSYAEETGTDGDPSDPGTALINGITISVPEGEDGVTPVPGFILKPSFTLDSVDKDSIPSGWLLIGDDNIAYAFKSDLSAYQQYMNPSDKSSLIILINSNETVGEDFVPADMIKVVNVKQGKNMQLKRDAEKSLEALFVEMYAEGFTDVYARRAYISYQTQSTSFGNALYTERYYYKNNYSKNGKYFSDAAYSVLGKAYLEATYITQKKTILSVADGTRAASSYCPQAGTSDHQTGLGADLWGNDGESAFGKTAAYAWLKENAYKFGFVERFPAGKEKITGRTAEPCHWRFVGQYHAAVMQEYGFCLEEYVAYITDGRN